MPLDIYVDKQYNQHVILINNVNHGGLHGY